MLRAKLYASIIFSVLCLSIPVSTNQTSKSLASDSHNILPNYPNDFTYIEFISINNDEDFLEYNITGLGTKEDPYIIENIVLEDERHDIGIAVRDTTKHFVIQNCTLRAYSTCIHLENVSEGTATIFNNICFVYPPSGAIGISIVEINGAIVRNNNCTREKGGITYYEETIGIFIRNSDNTLVVENICEKQNMYGIISHSNKNNLFEENSCIFNDVGIYVYSSNDELYQNNQFDWNVIGMGISSSNLSIINNTISFNEVNGIVLTDCKLSNITANSILFNGFCGVAASSTNQSQFTYNNFSNNTECGLYFDRYSNNNTIHHNSFVYNKVGGESQALDHGKNNLWYDKETEEGNYWNDWNSRKPYQISGDADAEDKFPLNESFERISFSTAGVIVSIIIISTLSIKLKKKKEKGKK